MQKITRYIPEIIQDVVNAKTTDEKVEILKSNDSKGLRMLLHFAVCPKYSKAFAIMPNYEPDDAPFGMTMSNLSLVGKKLPYLFKEHEMYVASDKRRLSIALSMLTSVHFTESALLEQIFQREFNSISADIVKKAFPDLF